MRIVDLTIPGRPVGYMSRTWKGRYTNGAEKFNAYCKKVRQHAMLAGLALPVESSPEHLVRVDTKAFFEDNVHPDSENVRKGIVDALFYLSNSAKKILKIAGMKVYGDKYVDGRHYPGIVDKSNPRVEVRIAFYLPGEFKEVDIKMNQINLDNWAG